MSLQKEWNEYLPISILLRKINAHFREEASGLHADLLEHILKVRNIRTIIRTFVYTNVI